MIKAFDTVDSIEPKNLSKSFSDFSKDELKKTLDSLINKSILNYFCIGGGYNDYSSYNLKPIGKKIAKRGFLKHNAIEFCVIIDKHKAWIPISVGIIGSVSPFENVKYLFKSTLG
ncbi:hypothetical protein [Pedobacter sp. PACM 27299]|uniref:hypothetical protein n=1 Tax=Pedobacter sp. PACM 27299 TaxID=1727164 RepID=UPI0012FB9196|nr:hypothetical protein [Pedobacter sp. PACM 27299]